MVFERVKGYFLREHEHDRYIGQVSSSASVQKHKFGLTPVESLIGGMIAGTVSVICTYPLDLTRAQMAVRKKHRHSPNQGFARVLADNYSKRGVGAGLFRGLSPTLLGILPYSGIAFSLNEQAKREVCIPYPRKRNQQVIIG